MDASVCATGGRNFQFCPVILRHQRQRFLELSLYGSASDSKLELEAIVVSSVIADRRLVIMEQRSAVSPLQNRNG